ncbi:hypothetical protein WJX72_006686 [[Myrmecia] bisecta]|uniref:Uncharacterized protein n=1 Tax=[Myrmecia] bisecta TaxID=41462 RepID=A0AAW1Q7D9_9CHLO
MKAHLAELDQPQHQQPPEISEQDLLVLAAEVRRLEEELAAAQADVAMQRQLVREGQEREGSIQAEVSAISGAYAEMRAELEATTASLEALQQAHAELEAQKADLDARLARQHTLSVRQVRAEEAGKMQLRMEKAEDALERERQQVLSLQQRLAANERAAKEGGAALQQAAQLRQSLRQAQSEAQKVVVGLQKEQEASSVLRAELVTARSAEQANSSLQAGLQQLTHAQAELAAELATSQQREEGLQLAMRIADEKLKAGDAVSLDLRAQNSALAAAADKLMLANSELADKVNEQAAEIAQLRAQLRAEQTERAQHESSMPGGSVASSRAPEASSQLHAANEARAVLGMSEADLHLMVLAEEVQRLEQQLQAERQLRLQAEARLLQQAGSEPQPDAQPPDQRTNAPNSQPPASVPASVRPMPSASQDADDATGPAHQQQPPASVAEDTGRASQSPAAVSQENVMGRTVV